MYQEKPPDDVDATNVTPPAEDASSSSAGQSQSRAGSRGLGSTDPYADPRKIAQQREAYDLWCTPMPMHRVAKIVGIGRQTAYDYVRIEADRRAAEMASEREMRIQQSIRTAELVRDRGLLHLRAGEGDIVKDERAAKMVLAAQEVIDKRVGLEAPVGGQSAQSTAALLAGLGPDAIRALFAGAAERRAAAIVEKLA